MPGIFFIGNSKYFINLFWNPADVKSQKQVRQMFEEMVGWAVEEGVDYIIGETLLLRRRSLLGCNRYEIRNFAAEAWQNNIIYLGVCCYAAPVHIRAVAEAMGCKPPASRYSENMKKHFIYGDDERLAERIAEYGDRA
jgi:hypothetical protein